MNAIEQVKKYIEKREIVYKRNREEQIRFFTPEQKVDKDAKSMTSDGRRFHRPPQTPFDHI